MGVRSSQDWHNMESPLDGLAGSETGETLGMMNNFVIGQS